VEGRLIDQRRPLDYLEDDVADAFFSAREYEAYYFSLKTVEQKRDFHDQLKGALERLLAAAQGEGLEWIDEILRRSEPAPQPQTGITVRLRPVEASEGMRLLGVDENVDFKGLREAYRAAALRCHPDRGGSNEAMVAVNRAYEQLHAAIAARTGVDESSMSLNSDNRSAAGYLWSVRLRLLHIALDDWALEDALVWLEPLLAEPPPAPAPRPGAPLHLQQRLPGLDYQLISPGLELAERLVACGRRQEAQRVLDALEAKVAALEGTQLNHQYFATGFGKTQEIVSGNRVPRFVINHIRQLENAYRFGAIDEKRYASTRGRLEKKADARAAAAAKEEELLGRTRFLSALPIDAGLRRADLSGRLVPEPGYYQCRITELSPDQQAQYLQAFASDARTLDLVQKYAWVRLSSLLRSAIYHVDSIDPGALRDEALRLMELQPKCKPSGEGVAEVLGSLAGLDKRAREKAAIALKERLEPETINAGPIVITMTMNIAPELGATFLDEAMAICRQHGSI